MIILIIMTVNNYLSIRIFQILIKSIDKKEKSSFEIDGKKALFRPALVELT